MKGKYESLILDFGGVLYHIDYTLTVKRFQEIGFENFDSWYSQAKQHALFDQLETGKLSEEHFYNNVRNISQINLSNQLIEEAWNALLIELPASRITLLKELSKYYKLFLLSNTNQIHAKAFKQEIEHKYGWEEFCKPFSAVYLSHEIGFRKPNADAFEFVVNRNNLQKEKTLFVDDSIQHIEGAAGVGIDSYFLDLKAGDSIELLVSKLM